MSLIPSGTTVTVETKYFPPITVDLSGDNPPSVSGQVAGVGAVLATKIIKPRVTLRFAGQVVKEWQPAGSPDPNEWKSVKVGLAVAAGLLAFKLLRIIL